MKLCLCQYSVRPQINDAYNHPGSVHISGHMGPLRMIPIAAGSYQGHVPYQTLNHGHVYNVQHAPVAVQHAPVAVHPMPVAPVQVGNYHVEEPASPVYQEPVAVHHVEPVIHPDDVQEYVEEEDAQSVDRYGRNIALNIDMVPIELSVPMLSLSQREPVRKQPKRKQRNHEELHSKRNPRFLGKWDIDLDIDDFDFKKTTNIHSNVDADVLYPDKLPLHREIHSGLSALLPHLTQLHQNINLGLTGALPQLSGLHQNINSGLSALLPQLTQLHQNLNSGLSAGLPQSSGLNQQIQSGLSATAPQLTRNIDSGLFTGLNAEVPPVRRVNPDEERLSEDYNSSTNEDNTSEDDANVEDVYDS